MAPILDVRDLRVHFHTRHGILKAVDGMSFQLEKGRVLGVVGESGSGKSVSCMSLLGLVPIPPARIESGRALFHGQDLLTMDPASLRGVRGGKICMVFQEPLTSLNPYLSVGLQMAESIQAHERATPEDIRRRSIEMLDRVGIADADVRLRQFPHEFSGGMRQRVMIAMALLTRPDILIADEPTTALDVTIQAQILDLLQRLKDEMGMSIILISHAMGVVAEMSDEILVMYAGRIVERGAPQDLFGQTAHPYTKALIESMPRPGDRSPLTAIAGSPPDLLRLPGGCPFAPRCAYAKPVCRETYPVERAAHGKPTHKFFCHVDI